MRARAVSRGALTKRGGVLPRILDRSVLNPNLCRHSVIFKPIRSSVLARRGLRSLVCFGETPSDKPGRYSMTMYVRAGK